MRTSDGMGAAGAGTGQGIELVLERHLDGPRELVFDAWTEPEQFSRWFGPRGSSIPHCRLEAQAGGKLHYCHRLPDGEEIWIGGWYEEVVRPERLAFRCYFSDAEGSQRPRPGFPEEMRIVVEFQERSGGTTMRIRHCGLEIDQGEVTGWTDSLERLEEFLGDVARKDPSAGVQAT